MEIKYRFDDSYHYTLRLLGRLWTNEEAYPLAYPHQWIPTSLHSHLKW